ncbi:MAG: BlaI/MecI/CopY family transcriptional regulator [Rikenellaceae bacterium]
MEKLTFQEEELMLSVWQTGQGAVKDFITNMKNSDIPYTTAASIVKNLEKKGFVTSRKFGNTYVYSAAINENEYKSKFMSGVVQKYFTNSYKDMVTFFVHKNKISAEELKEIIDLIEK